MIKDLLQIFSVYQWWIQIINKKQSDFINNKKYKTIETNQMLSIKTSHVINLKDKRNNGPRSEKMNWAHFFSSYYNNPALKYFPDNNFWRENL